MRRCSLAAQLKLRIIEQHFLDQLINILNCKDRVEIRVNTN